MMDIETVAKQELVDSMLKVMVTPNVKTSAHTPVEEARYKDFINAAKSGKKMTVHLALDFALRDEMFNLIRTGRVFIESSVKFVTTFTTKMPDECADAIFTSRYKGNEFNYSFLDNHPGIINIDKLKDIPTDYEGLMAVPPTILEYKNIKRFNVYRVLYAPKHLGKAIYPRVVVSNKMVTD